MKIYLLSLCLFASLPLYSQQYQLAESRVSFFSSAPMENIEAISSRAKSLLNTQTAEIAFVIPIKTFEFEKKLMQEHFNENYMESHKYPDATFKGKLSGFNPQQKGVQKVVARGQMNIHGVNRNVEAAGTLEYRDKEIYLTAVFPVKVADYEVEIPSLVFYNIAEEVEVTVKAKYLPYEKK
ncbi:YceI family protein [Cesiribacter sp. SM1]|uniref:YceI family protein n=1 Tax=Cesiribacter sp. SM1 TaxID=2861196 RepID=UPI001CD78C98|nr:YceI family protein [Cesiribacter sp. SM1]